MSVSPSREAEVEPMLSERVHAVVLHQPVEGGAVPQLETQEHVGPEVRAVGIRAAALAAREAEPKSEVGHGSLTVVREAEQALDAGHVGVDPASDAQFERRAE